MLTEGYKGSSEFTLVKMPHCWKSRVAAQLYYKTEQLLCSNRCGIVYS